MFKTDSVEDILLKTTDCTEQILALSHDLFSMSLEDNELMFEVRNEISRRLYNADIITRTGTVKISSMDILLSIHTSDSFSWVEYRAERLKSATIDDKFDESDDGNQMLVMCYICYCYFKSKFKDINKLADITRPVPIPLFINIANKDKNLEILFKDEEGCEYSGTLDEIMLRRNIFSMRLILSINIISKGKDGYVKNLAEFDLPFKDHASKLEDIGLTPITLEIKARLTERGRTYVKYTKEPSYCSYNDFAFRPGSWFGDIRTKVDGRVMVDINAMRVLNSSLDDEWYTGDPFDDDDGVIQSIPETDLWMASPIVFGFSFTTKDWLRMKIDSIKDIVFSDTAFDELIVPATYKSIFLSSLTNNMPSLDSIEGKGNGKIFLLYGPPGCGKTMTAESVAEFLRMPIYYVSVGDLGVSPESMESSLSNIMDIAISWNAIVLLDEVDVFAVKRLGADIQRNAMTAILLRLLERFNGILFMTTNLIDNLDEAFKSRATATIEYAELSSIERATIWRSLLYKADALDIVIHDEVFSRVSTLADYKLNGRDIKNCIRLAYSVAMSKPDKILDNEILDSVLALRSA